MSGHGHEVRWCFHTTAMVADYERTDGAEGAEWMGGECIILTSLGAKSGKIRKTPLIRITDGTSYAVIGSLGGAPTSPQWVSNLRANPLVELQDRAARRDYVVHEATGEEKARWWALATAPWPAYDDYAVRVQLWGDQVEEIVKVDPLTQEIVDHLPAVAIYPATHFVTAEDSIERSVEEIATELETRVAELEAQGKQLEACLLYTSPSPRDRTRSRMPSSA